MPNTKSKTIATFTITGNITEDINYNLNEIIEEIKSGVSCINEFARVKEAELTINHPQKINLLDY
jgi:hypothetical protein